MGQSCVGAEQNHGIEGGAVSTDLLHVVFQLSYEFNLCNTFLHMGQSMTKDILYKLDSML
ncbi:hypothetical protein D3C78_1609840 [compost metagenome]